MFRLDMFLVMKGYFPSRERAKEAIVQGKVFVDGKIAKPSLKIEGSEIIKVESDFSYVSRAGLKLEKAREVFKLDFADKVVLDIGSSTGGFTEVALLSGAKKVIAVDVGSKQLSEKLRKDERVRLYENCDFRFIESEKLKEVNLIVCDVSFISLRYIFPKIIEEFGTKIEGVFLFKPQFECGKEIASKYSGVIKNKDIHKAIFCEFCDYLENLGFVVSNIDYSPITGKSGNIEYLIHINKKRSNYKIDKVIDRAFEEL